MVTGGMPIGSPRAVLMFHGVGEARRAYEPDEEMYWVGWGQYDAMLDRLSRETPERYLITFDDGNYSDLEAARRMAARGLTGIFFVLVGKLDKPGYLTRAEVLEMQALGMEIGLHGRDHVDWRGTDDATLRSEIDMARDELSALCGKPIAAAAIPYGAYDRRVWRYLDQSGFTRIYTSDKGMSRPSDRFVRRNPVLSWHDAGAIADILDDKVSPLQRLRRSVMPPLKRNLSSAAAKRAQG